MSDSGLDRILSDAARTAHPVSPEVRKRIVNSIGASLRPVRPLPPTWVLVTGLVLIGSLVALLGAGGSGFSGFQRLHPWTRALVFCMIGVLTWGAATEFVGESIPGSRRRVSARTLLVAVSLALLAVFALSFRDYRTQHFVAAGIACLLTGLTLAIPAAIASCLLLRRGLVLNSVSAGLVGGVFAGLTGVTTLELQCTNFQALHILVWHAAVMPASGAAGALVGSLMHRRRR